MSDTAQCPFCKSANTDTPLTVNGYWWCNDCRRPFMPFTVGANDWVSVMVSDLEEKYISRQSFDALHTRLVTAEQRAEQAEAALADAEQRAEDLMKLLRQDHKDRIENAQVSVDRILLLEARVREMEAALSPILEACYLADVEGELSERIDGSLLDAARDALKRGPQ